MPGPLVSQYLYLLDEAFNGTAWHSLLGNLASVRPDDWEWLPPNGHRSIRSLVNHLGSTKLMYDSHAFRDSSLSWEDPRIYGGDTLTTIPSAIEWLRSCHEQLRQSVERLDDSDLLEPRMTNWGEAKEARWIIAIMIQHDHYHAGEINHIRALAQQNDRWEYDS